MNIRRRHDNVNVLNVTPLIDVVFILLVFFMLATNFMNYRLIRVETPRETEVVQTSEGAIVIGVHPLGALSFDTQPIEPNELDQRIAEIVAIDETRVFLVRPDDGVTLQEAIEIYDVARRSGARAVSFSPPEDEG